MKKGVIKVCIVCKKKFYLPYSRENRIYCSRICYYVVHKVKTYSCINCGKKYVHRIDSNGKTYCSRKCSGISKIRRGKISLANKGRIPWNKGLTSKIDTRIQSGKTSSNWRGGITGNNEIARRKREYFIWRIAVYTRDNYTCQMCGVRGGNLHADHIKPFALYPELRLDINNGRTLCVSCHRETETYGRNDIYRRTGISIL